MVRSSRQHRHRGSVHRRVTIGAGTEGRTMSRQLALGGDRLPASEDDTALAVALAAAVRSAGRRLGSEPRRVQAMVIDALGTRTRSRRAEVDASVLAAEEGVPELLADGDSITAELRLRARGL